MGVLVTQGDNSGVKVGVDVGDFVIKNFVLVGVTVAFGVVGNIVNILEHEPPEVITLYEPYMSLGGVNSEGLKSYGNITLPKLIT